MTLRRFYQLAFLLPVAVPLLTTPIAYLLRSLGLPGVSVLEKILSAPLVALTFGGGPYAITAAAALWYLRHKPTDVFWSVILWLPLFLGFLVWSVLFVLFGFYDHWQYPLGALAGTSAYAAIGTFTGYAYVGLTWLLCNHGIDRGWIVRSDLAAEVTTSRRSRLGGNEPPN
jgi:hypothetical protein